jgi:hypothetical protein
VRELTERRRRGPFCLFSFERGQKTEEEKKKSKKKKKLLCVRRKKNSNRSLFPILLKKHDTLKGTQHTLYEKYAFALNTK